jgi:hypothetical protein
MIKQNKRKKDQRSQKYKTKMVLQWLIMFKKLFGEILAESTIVKKISVPKEII